MAERQRTWERKHPDYKHQWYLKNRCRILRASSVYRHKNHLIISKRKRSYAEKNKEKIAAYRRKYYLANRVSAIENQKKYVAAHRNQRNAYKRRWRKLNAERENRKARIYYSEHRDACKRNVDNWMKKNYKRYMVWLKEYKRVSWAKLSPLEKKRKRAMSYCRMNENFWNRFLEKWKSIGRRCYLCKRYLPKIKITIDHVIPSSKGGSDDISNLMPACGPCNSSKGNKILRAA